MVQALGYRPKSLKTPRIRKRFQMFEKDFKKFDENSV